MSFGYRAGAWAAGILAVVLATALGGWLTVWGKSVVANSKNSKNPNGGPSISAIVDVDASDIYEYALADPVTSAADRITLESGTASDSDITTLIARHGGAAVGRFGATIVLEGRRSSLRIVDIRPRLRPVHTAPTAAFLVFPSAGAVPTIPVSADLDRAVPVLRSGSKPYFQGHQIDLSRGERVSLRVSFTAKSGYHEFDLDVTFVADGKQYHQIIPGPTAGVFRLAAGAVDYRAYRTVYKGLSGNQFEVASRSQMCGLFPKSRGC